MTNLLAFTIDMPIVIGIGVAVLAIAVIVFVVWYISMKNSLVRVVNQTEESWATIDVYLKKRYDLIPNLVNTVKGYAKHEEETLTRVINARSAITGATTADERIDAEKRLGTELKTLLYRTAEKYPELKANAHFMDLSNQLKSIEGDLVNARKYYNGNVRNYNDKIMMFPTSMVANKMHLKKKPYFELDTEEERRNPKVEF